MDKTVDLIMQGQSPAVPDSLASANGQPSAEAETSPTNGTNGHGNGASILMPEGQPQDGLHGNDSGNGNSNGNDNGNRKANDQDPVSAHLTADANPVPASAQEEAASDASGQISLREWTVTRRLAGDPPGHLYLQLLAQRRVLHPHPAP